MVPSNLQGVCSEMWKSMCKWLLGMEICVVAEGQRGRVVRGSGSRRCVGDAAAREEAKSVCRRPSGPEGEGALPRVALVAFGDSLTRGNVRAPFGRGRRKWEVVFGSSDGCVIAGLFRSGVPAA